MLSTLATQIRKSEPTCGAASPIPFSVSIVFTISKTSFASFGSLKSLTSSVFLRRKSFGYFIILRVLFIMAINFGKLHCAYRIHINRPALSESAQSRKNWQTENFDLGFYFNKNIFIIIASFSGRKWFVGIADINITI